MRRAFDWLRRASGPVPDPSRAARVVDAVLAGLLLAYALVTIHRDTYTATHLGRFLADKPFGRTDKVPPVPGWLDAVSAVATTVPLALRSRYPLAVFWIVVGTTVAGPAHGVAAVKLAACAVAAYTAAAHSPYRPAATVSVAGSAAAVAGLYQNVLPTLPKVAVAFLVVVPIAAAGISLRALRVRVAESQARERALERDRARAAELATEQERARIARELHDVITHNVSVMLVQAGAARKVLARSPDQATTALLAVESAGRAAMTELQHTMGLLAPDGDTELAPQPGLAELGALIGRVRDAGVRVDVDESGTPVPLAAGADLAAYRVVQEALTNAARHAAGAPARVRVAYTPDVLVVEVDSGAGRRAPGSDGTGRGLIGLRERLAACGGSLHAGPHGDGGYRVRAVIPL